VFVGTPANVVMPTFGVALLACAPAAVLVRAAGQLTITTPSKEALALYERAREYV
jgi:hypothetical protein